MPKDGRLVLQLLEALQRLEQIGKVVIREIPEPDALAGDEIHDEYDPLVGQVSHDAVVAMVRAGIDQVNGLGADAHSHLVPERAVGHDDLGIRLGGQRLVGFRVGDDGYIVCQRSSAADVIGVVMAVDDGHDRLGCDLGDLALVDLGCLRRYRVEGDDALAGDEKDGVVRAEAEPVYTVRDLSSLVLWPLPLGGGCGALS